MRTFVPLMQWRIVSKWVVDQGGKRVTVHYKRGSGYKPELTTTRLHDLLKWKRKGLVKEKRRKRKEKQ